MRYSGTATMDLTCLDESDDALAEQAAAGDMAAFERLVRRHQERVMRIAMRYLGDAARAADVTQETFLQLYKALPRYRASGKFTPYLAKIALNQCRMQGRATPKGLCSLDTGMAVHAMTVNPQVDGSDLNDLLQKTLVELSDKLREVVILRCVEGFELAEIADLLAVPLGTVKSRLFAGLAQLRTALAEHL